MGCGPTQAEIHPAGIKLPGRLAGFSDHRHLGTGERKFSEKASCKLWDAQTGRLLRTIGLGGEYQGWLPWPSFSPDSRWIAVNSSSGNQITEVFEVKTGRRVFLMYAWSPHFLDDGQTLVTVKDNDVQLRDTKTWEPRASVPFDLGKHWDNGGQISPEPVAIPGGPLLAVFPYYPSTSPQILSWLGRELPLNAFGSGQMTLIDGATGENRVVVLHGPTLFKHAFSPDGSKMVIEGLDGVVTVYDIPPGRSWRPLAILLGITLLGLGLVSALRHAWRIMTRRRLSPET